MMYNEPTGELNFIDDAHICDIESGKPYDPVGTPLFCPPEQYKEGVIKDELISYILCHIALNVLSKNPNKYEVACSPVVNEILPPSANKNVGSFRIPDCYVTSKLTKG